MAGFGSFLDASAGAGGGGSTQAGMGQGLAGLMRLARQPTDPLARANAQGLINDPALMAALRRGAIRRSAARRRSGDVMSRLAGLDPMTARFAQVDTEGRASGDLSGFLGNAQLEQLMGGQAFKRGLFTRQMDYDQQAKMARLQAQIERENRPGFGQQLLGVAGGLAGSYLGGPGGAALGSRMFGGGGGSRSMNSSGGVKSTGYENEDWWGQ